MGRPPKKRLVVTPDWFHEQKENFILNAFHHYPDAFVSLRDGAKQSGTIPCDQFARQWTRRFALEGTWVEHWATDTLCYWELNPYLANFAGPPNSTRTGMAWPLPRRLKPSVEFKRPLRLPKISDRDELLAALQADLAKLFHGVEQPKIMGWLEVQLKAGSLVEIDEPQNLDLKIECAALYYFGAMTPQEIADRKGLRLVPGSTMTAGVRESVNRWLKEVSKDS